MRAKKSNTNKNMRKEFLYARNDIMGIVKTFDMDKKKEALQFIQNSGVIETYELRDDYYYLTNTEEFGTNKHPGSKGKKPKFGEYLQNRRIHINNARWFLGV